MQEDPQPNPSPGEAGAGFDHACRNALEALAQASRDGSAGAIDRGFDAALLRLPDTVLTVRFADSTELHTTPQAYLAQVAADDAPHDDSLRAGDHGGHHRTVLPFDLVLPGGVLTRAGGGQLHVDQYRLARLTDAGKPAALPGTLSRGYENATLHPAVGETDGCLLAWNRAANAWVLPPGALPPVGQADRVLLLLHGIAASTEGSFGALWHGGTNEQAEPAPDWQQLVYRPARDAIVVLAFEHRSLSASPLRNLIDLVDALKTCLKPGCRIDLLSHSRGGLVGELLAIGLGGEAEDDALRLARRQQLVQRLGEVYGPEHPDAPLLDHCAARLATVAHQRWRAGTFVRVACPARGALLADQRTDLFLSLLLHSLGGASGGPGTRWHDRLAALVRGLVAARAEARTESRTDARTDTQTLPGLEAMVPGAPLTVALNSLPDDLVLADRLRVVAGDASAPGLGGLLTLPGEVFHGLHDHDLVVATEAMFGGARRSDAMGWRLADPTLSHFGYFQPDSPARGAIVGALLGRDDDFRPPAGDPLRNRGWPQAWLSQPLSRCPWAQSLKRVETTDHPERPLLLLLPGLMGSELALAPDHADHPAWLSTQALLRGELRQLALDAPTPLVATGLVAVAYERLLNRAGQRCHVLPWPFDWRQDLQALGDLLVPAMQQLLALAQQRQVPLHLLAHSMGGLVARAALFGPASPAVTAEARAALWSGMRRTGGRLLMLGTPNRGTYAPVQLLIGQHPLASLVGVAASGVTAQGLSRMSGQFPGLLAMLPHPPDPEFGDLLLPDAWARLADADAAVVRPDPAALARAAEVRVWLADSFAALRQDDHVLYVAGQGATPQGLRRVAGLAADGVAGSTLRLGVSVEGDGTVPWNATLAPERTWYVPAGHGDLADHVDAFDAYLELLQQGNTQALTQQPPATRGLLDSRALGPRPSLPSLPVDPAAYVLGVSQANEALRWLPPIELRVVHGSLDYARFPLMVGHYVDDGLLGAVRRVDDKLQGQLAEVLARKLFMGAERTAMYLRPGSRDGQPPAYPGAVVLGLGSVGTLTPTSLADTVTRGVLRYAFEHRHQDPWAPAEGPLLLRLSTLMLGTHVQAVSPRDSIAGVLQGVWRAQQILAADAAGQRPVRVAELELIEIEGAVALDAAYEVQRLLDRPEWRGRYHWADGTLETRAGALRGYRPGGQGSVWQRLAVREDEAGGLKFELIAERARVESTHVQAEVAAMKAYMARLCDAGATGQSPAADQHRLGQVLFRMLLPTLLKSRLGNFDRTVLVLDDKTAALPWELLTPTTEAGNDAARPLAVQAGLVRQRLTTEFRQLPTTVTGWDVLLVGNPATSGWKDEHGQKLRFNPLPGARREADRVKALLDNDARPWRTHNLPNNASVEQVRSALLDRPWRVLLLAGHGMVDLWVGHIGEGEARRPLRRTGLVLSDQHMLSAGDVEQMDPPPELVFINGCYSGIDGAGQHAATDNAAAPPGSSRNLPLLASSLALQFIRMGAKAVVAAGWQVSDDDALQFAERFFQAMLQGQRFGDAVQQARTWIYRDGRPRSNTWGAYQCYGDPEWRLVDDGPRPAAWDEARSDLLRDAARCMSKWELAERIERVVGIAGDGPAGPLVRKLDDLVEALRRDPQRQRWLRSSQVRAALAEAYRELGQHPQALTWTQRGVRTAYSRLQLRHLEFAVNSLSRLRTPEGHRTAQALIDTLDQLERLLRQPVLQLPEEPTGEVAVGAHSERLCLKGSDLLRLGFQESDPHRCAQLMFDSAGCYGRGYVEKRDPEDLTDRRAYALSNAMVAAGMAALLDPARLRRKVRAGLWLAEPPPGARDAEPVAQPVRPRRRQAGPRPLPLSWDRETHRLLAELERSGPAGTFWHYTNRMDLLVGRLVLRLSLGLPLPQDDMGQVARLAETALVRCPAPVEVDSMVSRFNQVAQVLGQTPARARRTTAPLAAAVQRVVQTLEDYVQRAGVRTDA